MQNRHPEPLEVNDLMVAIVAKALRWDTIRRNNAAPWSDYVGAGHELIAAITAYRKTLDGA